MAAANGAMPQRPRPKYDPVALRQPQEPELSGWRKLLSFFIHERVQEVDRRDRWWGLTVWFLVLAAYGVYLLYLLESRFEQRRHPPISVNVVENKPLTAQAAVSMGFVAPRNTSINDWVFQVNFSTFYETSIDTTGKSEGLNSSSCPTCGGYYQGEGALAWNLTVTEAFKGAPDEMSMAWLHIDVTLSRRESTTYNDSVPESVPLLFWVGHSCHVMQTIPECEKEKITSYEDDTTIYVSKTGIVNHVKFETDKLSKLPGRWQPSFSLPSWLTGAPNKVHKQWETWSYRPRTAQVESSGELGAELRATILLILPTRITTYEEQEPFDVLATFGIAAGTWGAVVFVITLLLPMRPSGRRRIWPCCWRLSARLLHQENKNWDTKRRRDTHQEMNGDIEAEMKEVENQSGDVDIAVLELPSLEDRVARTERRLRRLLNPTRPRKTKVKRLHQQRRHYRPLRQQNDRLFAAPLQQPHSSDEGSDTESDLEGSGGGGEVKQ